MQKSLNFIASFGKADFFYDDPISFHYFVKIKKQIGSNSKKSREVASAGGISFFNDNEAKIKAIVEAVERFALYNPSKPSLIKHSYKELINNNINCCNPFEFTRFSSSQLTKPLFTIFKFNENSKFDWIRGNDALKNKEIYIPYQLVFLGNSFLKENKIIEFPVSTGAAGGFDMEGAIFRGICEIIERDSFMIYYLNTMVPPKIDISVIKDKKLKFLINYIRDYNLEVHLFDITTDLPVFSFLTIIIDRNKLGLPVAIGLKSGLNPKNTLINCIQESFHIRPWARKLYFQKLPRKNKPATLTERAVYWNNRNLINSLNFMLKSESMVDISKYKNLDQKSNDKNLTYLLNVLREHNLKTYWIDITPKFIKKMKLVVVKTFIPSMQPVYFNENFPYLGIKRLYEVPVKLGFREKTEQELNKIPHPLL